MKIIYILSIILIIVSAQGSYANDSHANSSHVNEEQYKQVFKHIEKKNWLNAENLAKSLGDQALLKIVLAQKFLDESYNSSFEKIVEFLKKNPKWPQHSALKVRAENLINNSTDKTQVYNWFQKHKPKTPNGYKHYALAASTIIDDQPALTSIIKDGWIYGGFGKEEKIVYYDKFRKYISTQDTVNRIDNMIWRGSISEAEKSLNNISLPYRDSFKAQIALLNNKDNSRKLFESIPKEYYTQGLVYRYINLIKTDLPSAKKITNLLNLVKNNKGHGDDFWKVQRYIVREHIQNNQFKEAYIIASNHFAVTPENISEAEFLSGWLALRFLKKPDIAIEHFKKFQKVVKTPISMSRGLYWQGRAYAAKGNDQEAKKLFQHAAYKFGYTYYGQVATMELNEKKLRLPPKITLANHKNEEYVKNNDILRAVKLVGKYGSNSMAKIYFTALINSTDEEQEILAIALEMQGSKLHHKVWMSKNATQKHVFIDHFSFPTPYKVKELPLEEALTFSIIRQESTLR